MLRDEKFEGPDLRIKEELARRRQLPPEILASLHALMNRSATRPPPRPRPTDPSARRAQTKYPYNLGPQNDTKIVEDPIFITIHSLMQFLIYSVQERLDEVRPIIDKYEEDDRLRFGHIFCKLDKFRTDLLAIFVERRRVEKRSVMSRIKFHQRLLMKNMDITYTIEYLVYLQNKHRERIDQHAVDEINRYHAAKKAGNKG